MTFKPYPVLTLFTAVSFVILIMFGNWQWSRFGEKKAMLAAEPEWATVSGALMPGTVRQIYSLTDGSAAWRDVVLVDMGDTAAFVAQTIHYGMEPPAPSVISQPQFFSARGIWHEGKHRNTFSSPDAPEKGQFQAFDPAALSATLDPELAARVDPRIFEPETILRTDGALPEPVENPFMRPELDDPLPPERHFGYALTWWGLAIGLIGVYLALHHQRGRLRFRGNGNP
jgi:surfeit locus 1 family protein